MNIFKLRFLLTISMLQFIFGPVEVVTLAGGILELASGTVEEIRDAICLKLGIEEWSVILLQGTKMLDDLTMTIADGEKLSMMVSKNPKTFATWISKSAREMDNGRVILDCRIQHKSTDNGSQLEVQIYNRSDSLWGVSGLEVEIDDRPKAFLDGVPGLYSTNFPTNLAEFPLIFEKILDGLSLNRLTDNPSERQDYVKRLSEHYKDDAMMLAMIEFINDCSTSDQCRLCVYDSHIKEIRFNLVDNKTFEPLGRLIEILMG